MMAIDEPGMFIYIVLLIAIAVSGLAAPLAMWITRRTGIVSFTSDQSETSRGSSVPLAGGITLFIALAVLSIVFKFWSDAQFSRILIGALIIFLSGLLEDVRSSFRIPKILAQLAAGAALILSGSYIHFFKSFSLLADSSAGIYQVFDFAVTLVWVIVVTNMINLVDTMDGLSISLSTITFGFLAVGFLMSNQLSMAQFVLCLFGICTVLLFWNVLPARLNLGNSGSLMLGYLLSIFAILYTPQTQSVIASTFLPVLLVGVPVFDTLLVMVSRMRRQLAVFKPQADHINHRLIRMGLDDGRAVLLIVFTAFVLDCVAFAALSLPSKYGYMIFAGYLLAGSGLFFYLDRRSFWA